MERWINGGPCYLPVFSALATFLKHFSVWQAIIEGRILTVNQLIRAKKAIPPSYDTDNDKHMLTRLKDLLYRTARILGIQSDGQRLMQQFGVWDAYELRKQYEQER
jgi:hypothetical protein